MKKPRSKRYREKEALQQNIQDLNDELTSLQESLSDDIRDEVIIATKVNPIAS